jgi:hypothetical protein
MGPSYVDSVLDVVVVTVLESRWIVKPSLRGPILLAKDFAP